MSEQPANTEPAAKKDFFVSYTGADRQMAEWVAWHLEDNGYSVVFQAWDFSAGCNFVAEMDRAAREAERTIAVLSQKYFQSRFTEDEWTVAFAKGTLLPVRIEDFDVEGLLSVRVYIDLAGLTNEADAKARLLAGVRQERGKPDAPPPFRPLAGQARTITRQPHFPGASPPIWNVPHPRNLNFTGRDELLTELRESLNAGNTTALTQPQAVTGLGGIGKTQLALEYTYRHAADYDLVWWVRAEENATLTADYAGLAAQLGLPEKDAPDLSAQVDAVRRWLERNGRWLLVLDNATDAQALRSFLPRSQSGHVIITSRATAWGGAAHKLAVKVWPRAESVAFLLRRTGQADADTASVLAEELGDLPLALEQAGAYMETTGKSLAGYLRLFRARRRELLERGQPATDYPATVATTWELSFQQARATAPAAGDLLNLCAFLAPDAIPLALLTEHGEALPAGLAEAMTDELAFDDALAALRRFSLIEMAETAERFSIHRLVQAVTRQRLSEAKQKTWATAAVQMVNTAFPDDSEDVRTWPVCAVLTPHALATAEKGERMQVAAFETARLLNQCGLYFYARAEHQTAEPLYRRALSIAENSDGPDHPNVAAILAKLAPLLQDTNRLAEAEPLYRHALSISENSGGPDHPNVARDLNNLAQLLKTTNRLAEAEPLYKRALAIDVKSYGPDHPNIARDLNNLALLLKDTNRLAEAEPLMRRVIAIFEESLGENHPNVATSLNNLARLLQATNRLAEAEPLMRRVLEILLGFTVASGHPHPHLQDAIGNYASLLAEMGHDTAQVLAALDKVGEPFGISL